MAKKPSQPPRSRKSLATHDLPADIPKIPKRRGAVVNHDGDGKFMAGNKGGPGGARPGSGRPKDEVREAERRLWDELRKVPTDDDPDAVSTPARMAVDAIVRLIGDPDPHVVIKAAGTVLNRVFGRSRVTVEVDGTGGRTLGEIDEITAAQIAMAGMKPGKK